MLLLSCSITVTSQEVNVDERLKPHLNSFFAICNTYNIEYNYKLNELKNITIVDTLASSSKTATLGMLERDKSTKVENILVNWITMLDQQILKIVAFHEFGHYFLEYDQHTCEDCGNIMSVTNSSYFDIANDWENQVKILFEQSPAYLKKQNQLVSRIP